MGDGCFLYRLGDTCSAMWVGGWVGDTCLGEWVDGGSWMDDCLKLQSTLIFKFGFVELGVVCHPKGHTQ